MRALRADRHMPPIDASRDYKAGWHDALPGESADGVECSLPVEVGTLRARLALAEQRECEALDLLSTRTREKWKAEDERDHLRKAIADLRAEWLALDADYRNGRRATNGLVASVAAERLFRLGGGA